MAGIANSTTFAEFARLASKPESGLGIPLPAAGPLSADTGREIVQIAVSDVKRRFATGTAPDGTKWRPLKYPRPNGGDQPLKDTGALAASITGESSPTEVVVGTNRVGARLMNYGGIVRPKNAKVLTIPLTKEAKRAGSPRRLSKTGDLPLFARMVNGQWIGHFLCVKQVTVPARPFIALSPDAIRIIGRVLLEAAGKSWEAS